MKHLIGKWVWLMPTGNNIGRFNKEIKTATITKVAKVNVSFVLDGWTREEKLRISEWKEGGTLHIRNESNGGFIVFESLQEIEDYNEANTLRQYIRSFIGNNKLGNLSLDTLRKVKELIGE